LPADPASVSRRNPINTPKSMVEIGGKPILWYVMSHYYSYGMNEFFIAFG
jgi:glucose-1-phosphate cytidylyltransferase